MITNVMSHKHKIVSKKKQTKVATLVDWGWPEGSLFNSYYTEV